MTPSIRERLAANRRRFVVPEHLTLDEVLTLTTDRRLRFGRAAEFLTTTELHRLDFLRWRLARQRMRGVTWTD